MNTWGIERKRKFLSKHVYLDIRLQFFVPKNYLVYFYELINYLIIVIKC